jgi:hypothetical protein
VEFNDNIGTVNPTGQTTFTAGPYNLFNSFGALPADAQSPNWGAVNYLLNDKGGNSVVDIQEAIWFLLNGAFHDNAFISGAPSAPATALVATALLHNNFVPAPGQVVAVLLDGGDGLSNVPGDSVPDTQSIIIEITVPPQTTGCPATQGFWQKGDRWPNITVTVDGIIYNGGGMTIGGTTYTKNQLLLIMPSGSLHTGGYVNGLSQLIAAVLNLVAGAQHTATIDSTISSINTALTGQQPFLIGNSLNPAFPASLRTLLSNDEGILDAYNSATGLGCSEGSGLTLGSNH